MLACSTVASALSVFELCCRALADGSRLKQSKTEIVPSDGQPVIVRSAIRDVSNAAQLSRSCDEASGTTALLLVVGLADDPRQIGSQMQNLMKHLPSIHGGKNQCSNFLEAILHVQLIFNPWGLTSS